MNNPFAKAAAIFAVLWGAAVVEAQNAGPVQQNSAPVWESCEEMHDMYVGRFESLRSFGLARMAKPPMLDLGGALETGRASYSLDRLELIGLLQHPGPVVYVPQMHGVKLDISSFKSRELTTFEKNSIEAFRSGRSITTAVDPQSDAMLCAGALRAKETCVHCHEDTKIGDLLGAFTYSLRRR